MKNYKGIVLVVTLLCVNNVFVGMNAQQRIIKLPTVSFSLRSILDGVLGSEYALKAREIYSYNDAKARQRGDYSLMGKLNEAIAGANANPSPQMRVDQLRTAIATIYNDLLTYRTRDNAQVSQQAQPLPSVSAGSLSLQSILNGALGEPYTSKVNEVYNSNVPVYVDALVKDINGTINSYYPDESKRISAIKTSIDKNYKFLENYRKTNQPPVAMNRPQSVRPLPSIPAPAPADSLSLQSILNGALGEPYTSKVNEVYNSNVPVYVDALVKDINGTINSYYPDEAKRIGVIKLLIDKNYNFLSNYRKTNQPPVAMNRPQSVQPLPPVSAGSLSLQKQGLIIVLDDSEKDSPGIGAAKITLLTALYQEAGSIIVSTSLLAPLFEQRLKDKRNIRIMLDEFNKEFRDIDDPIDLERFAILANRIAFDPERWIIKKMSDVLMLLIPRAYLRTLHIAADKVEAYSNAAVLSDVELQLGLRVNHMQTVDAQVMSSFKRGPGPEGFADYFIDSCDSIFCQKSDYKDRQVSIPSFIMCMYGHGALNQSIVGLSLDGFKKLLHFLESKIMMQLLVVFSCYAAGFNASKLYGEMRLGTQQYYSFPIIVQGLNDLMATSSLSDVYTDENDNKKVKLKIDIDFVSFFKKAKELEGNYAEVIKPISEDFINNTPQIKLPGAEWFSVIEGDKKIVSIGSTLAKTRDPQKPLDVVNFFKKDPELILLYTDDIPFELTINSSHEKAIVAMVPSKEVEKDRFAMVIRIKKISSIQNFDDILYWFRLVGNSDRTYFFIDEIGDNKDILIHGAGDMGMRVYYKDKNDILFTGKLSEQEIDKKLKNITMKRVERNSGFEKLYQIMMGYVREPYPKVSASSKQLRQEITPEQIEKIKNVIVKQHEKQLQEAKK